jgi:putative nucleotidyltransferase with HDIG domain
MDLISPAVVNHHKRVAYIAASIAANLRLEIWEQRDVILAALLHDVGAFSSQSRVESLEFESESPDKHTEIGYLLLRELKNFSHIAMLIRYHHIPWNERELPNIPEIPQSSHLINLADRVDVLANREENILSQTSYICNVIRHQSGKTFAPHHVESFLAISTKESFWFDIISPDISTIIMKRFELIDMPLSIDIMPEFSRVFSQIIDFRSRFTATHSRGVASTAVALGRLSGMSTEECKMLHLAGELHDLGKLAVPAEILEKSDELSFEEYDILKAHAYHTYHILESIDCLGEIVNWAAYHHERLDGNGYPFHLRAEKLSLGARIMAVADVFTALTEDRSYRKGMDKKQALKTLHEMVQTSELDGRLVSMLVSNYANIDEKRKITQAEALEEYKRFDHYLKVNLLAKTMGETAVEAK